MANGNWLKRIVIGLIAAIAALFVTKKKVAAPGSKGDADFKLPPVPDARASGPEDATPLTEDEQKMMASRAPEFKGFSAPAPEAVDAPDAPGPEEATPLTEEERAAFEQRLGVSGSASTDPPPPPISYEIAKANADEAEKLREAGDEAGAAALEKRMYFAGSATDPSEPPPPVSHEIAKANADEADKLREAGDEEGADALDQRMYAAGSDEPSPPISYEIAKENADEADKLREAGDTEGADARDQRVYFAGSTESHDPGDTTPDATSEAFDVVTDGADHTGQDSDESDDPTSEGLDVDGDQDDDDDPALPDLTSESFDTGNEALGISAGSNESGAATVAESDSATDTGDVGFITVPDDQTWCPDEFPIKGNANSRIFHKPGESSYDATNPEICFATDEAAVAQGFRPRKR